MVESRTAVVVGAGIGGLAAVCALHADGWDVRLLERADEVRPLGAGLALWRNALVALDFLAPELAEQVSRRPRISGQAGLRTPDGRWLLRMSGSQVERRKDLPVMVERPELYAGLRAGVPETAFRFGRTVVEVRHDGDRTVVGASTANGDESYPADLVVGADGIGSRLRPLVDERSKRIAAGYLSWRGIVPAELVPADLAPAQLAPPVEPPIRAGRLPANLEDGGGETWGRGQRFGFSPLSDGGINWYATLATADPRAKSQLDRARLLDLVAGWHRPIEDLIQRTPDDRLLQNDTELLWPLPRTYVSGRLALLGDAAHAMTPDLGQGACQALEDAVELATVVRSVRPADVPAALRRYDELRRPRTTKLARQARGIGRVSQLRNPLAAGLRDRLVRLVPVDAAMRGLDATLDWQPSAPRANRAT